MAHELVKQSTYTSLVCVQAAEQLNISLDARSTGVAHTAPTCVLRQAKPRRGGTPRDGGVLIGRDPDIETPGLPAGHCCSILVREIRRAEPVRR